LIFPAEKRLPIPAANGKVVTKISEATSKDVDIAVKAAQKAFDTVWGLNVPGAQRSRILHKLADLMEKNADELAALEALDNGASFFFRGGGVQRVVIVVWFFLGKTFSWAKAVDVTGAIATLRYYAGWADKLQGKTIEVRISVLPASCQR
jgi:aldehyde dehydrogenase (NAD+)